MEQLTTAQTLRKVAVLIDTALEPLYTKSAMLEHGYREAAKIRDNAKYGPAAQERYAAKAKELHELKVAVLAEIAPLEAIARAGSWTRFIYVPAGHVHRFSCPTLYPTTERVWLPDYSGSDEAQVVEAAADRACTVCFPSAPVDRPTTIPALVKEREEREAEAAAKAKAKQEAAAAAVKVGRETFKSLRAAENKLSYHMDNMVCRAYLQGVDAEHNERLRRLAAEDRQELMTLVDAIKTVYPAWDAEAVLAKKFMAKVKEYRKGGFDIPADATFSTAL